MVFILNSITQVDDTIKFTEQLEDNPLSHYYDLQQLDILKKDQKRKMFKIIAS